MDGTVGNGTKITVTALINNSVRAEKTITVNRTITPKGCDYQPVGFPASDWADTGRKSESEL